MSKCTSLRELDCDSNNQLSSLKVSGCKALVRLVSKRNLLTVLDVSKCTSLRELNCEHDQLKTLNIAGCKSLMGLICHGNQLTALDVSTCPKSIAVACDKGVKLVNTPTIFTDTIPNTTR